ncbi:hypothetical protein QR680_009425 [Steinernema hermaphroditum]|uniref:peptidylamidoglycolate lyase n=1 Tax=Steinernema hermaphroditum TaxID=289476 RepID=A0AA39IMM3_9BILA|nr:hypothetical protein QR680_009425 [Steinernema hermaphroditum]
MTSGASRTPRGPIDAEEKPWLLLDACPSFHSPLSRRRHMESRAPFLLIAFLVGLLSAEIFDYNYEPSFAEENPFDDQIVPSGDGKGAFVLPLSEPLGQVAGIAIDADNRVLVFHRADHVWDASSFDKSRRLNKSLGPIQKETIFVVNAESGKVLEKHGAGQFFMPHGIAVDAEGNVFVTDVGLHQVIRLDKHFKPTLTLGHRLEPGADETHFCQPTDVAVASNGDFFVADGYCNSRVMKFDKSGKVLAVFGRPPSDLPSVEGEFLVPHSLALIEDMNLICVADRENERIQCFSAGLAEGLRSIPTGIFITGAEDIGRVYAIREKEHYLIGVTDSKAEAPLESQLFAMDMNTGKASVFLTGVENAHSLAIANDGSVYIAQIGPNQILRVLPGFSED